MRHYEDIEAMYQRPARATRKPKTGRVPRTRAGGEWTEAAFWSFLRSGLRQLSRRWPPATRLIWQVSKRPYRGPNRRQKWEHQCSVCGRWGKRAEMQADHVIPCGTLKSWDDLPGFAARLLCEVEGLQILCEQCHQTKTNGHGDTG